MTGSREILAGTTPGGHCTEGKVKREGLNGGKVQVLP